MMNSQKSPAIRFDRLIEAEPGGVAEVRVELGQWLQQQLGLDSVRLNDVVLAVYEALANAAEFAYVTSDTPGSVRLQADHDAENSALILTVSDKGNWRHTDPSQRCLSRGRGLPLIEGLADQASFDTSTAGTTVRMVFEDVPTAGVPSC
jgi:serine/threonine-protein kinase RsbW